MSFEAIRRVFKHIHKLSSKDPYLAQIAKANIRTHFDIYKKTKKEMKSVRYKQKDGELLEAFEKFIEQTIIQNSKYSQKAKMKLIELCYGLNKFVDADFQLRRDYKSAQICHLQSYEQFTRLQTEQQKEFVKKLIKKVLNGDETYPYKNLTDFFKDFRSQNSVSQPKDILKRLDEAARSHITGIIQDKISISPDYRNLYNIYFSIESPFSSRLSDYISSRYIMIDFDNFLFAHQRNQLQLENQAQLKRKKNNKRLQGIKATLKDKENILINREQNHNNQVQIQKQNEQTKVYTKQTKAKVLQDKKHERQYRKPEQKETSQKKNVKSQINIAVSKKWKSQDASKQIDLTTPKKKATLTDKKQQQLKIQKQSNQKIEINRTDEKQELLQSKFFHNNKKSSKGFLKKK